MTGKDILGNAIVDTIALSGSSAVPGVKAFASVTEYTVPCETHAGTDTCSLGNTKAMGIPYLLGDNGYATQASSQLGATYDGSTDAGTLLLHASDVSQSIYTPFGSGDGTKKVRVCLVVAKF